MSRRPSAWRIALIGAITAATVSFHYGVLVPDAHGSVIHAIHGRLCYVPIILAAVWFGVRGGLATALAITALTLPYPWLKGITDHHALLSEYTEMVFYVAIGLMTGVLIERQWRERARSDALQNELARQERLSSLGQMAAGLAHEIRNPLGSIQGAAEMLGDRAAPGSREGELFDVLRKESRRLGTVVDHFLGFARPRPLAIRATDPAAVAARAAAQMELDAAGRGVAIARAIEPGLPALQADPEQLHQVLLNLLLNAIAATPAGGRVEVAAARVQHDGTRCVALSVRDTGAGIAPEILPRVFDPFFTTRDGGTGLGLSICHRIVREHGGWIDIDTRSGGGTRVAVILPVEETRGG